MIFYTTRVRAVPIPRQHAPRGEHNAERPTATQPSDETKSPPTSREGGAGETPAANPKSRSSRKKSIETPAANPKLPKEIYFYTHTKDDARMNLSNSARARRRRRRRRRRRAHRLFLRKTRMDFPAAASTACPVALNSGFDPPPPHEVVLLFLHLLHRRRRRRRRPPG